MRDLQQAQGPGIGVVGYGRVAAKWHLPMYRAAGFDVAAICEVDAQARQRAAADWPDIPIHDRFEALLEDDRVQVVDLATPPGGRLQLIREAVDQGRHVLSQKPFATTSEGMDEVADLAVKRDVKVAVNQNGRFAPAWRRTSELLQEGSLGRIRAITHVFDTNLRWKPEPEHHGSTHFLLFDYTNHWIDISAHWLGDDRVVAVRAGDHQSARYVGGEIQQTAWVVLESASGVTTVIRGSAAGISHRSHDFMVQCDGGTLRGAVDAIGGERLAIDDGTTMRHVALDGEWFGDGFRGAMAELLAAIAEDREPLHSLRDNVTTVNLVAAVCTSADQDGERVAVSHRPRP